MDLIAAVNVFGLILVIFLVVIWIRGKIGARSFEFLSSSEILERFVAQGVMPDDYVIYVCRLSRERNPSAVIFSDLEGREALRVYTSSVTPPGYSRLPTAVQFDQGKRLEIRLLMRAEWNPFKDRPMAAIEFWSDHALVAKAQESVEDRGVPQEWQVFWNDQKLTYRCNGTIDRAGRQERFLGAWLGDDFAKHAYCAYSKSVPSELRAILIGLNHVSIDGGFVP